MKKAFWASVAVMMAVGLTAGTAQADGSIYGGNSNPAVLYVYSSYTWSPIGTWDFTNYTSIPATAKVWAVQESWEVCTLCNLSPSTTHVALYNGQGNGYYLDGYNGVMIQNDIFAGEPVHQKWMTRFYSETTPFSNGGYIIPKFWLWWKDGVSGTSGVTSVEQTGKKETKLLPAGTINPTGFTF